MRYTCSEDIGTDDQEFELWFKGDLFYSKMDNRSTITRDASGTLILRLINKANNSSITLLHVEDFMYKTCDDYSNYSLQRFLLFKKNRFHQIADYVLLDTIHYHHSAYRVIKLIRYRLFVNYQEDSELLVDEELIYD